jgi:hypothetical protein
MRRIVTVVLVALITAMAAADDGRDSVRLTYDVLTLKGKLFREIEPDPLRLTVGDSAGSGDRLRTGSRSRTELVLESHAARFAIGPKTRFTLGHDRPGVLMHLDRGRLRAVLGRFSGDDFRLVTTTSVVLATSNSEYGLKVAKDGDTQLVVFSGSVGVTEPVDGGPPLWVEAGMQTTVRSGRQPDDPTPHSITPKEWDLGRTSPALGMGRKESNPYGSSGSGSRNRSSR